VAEFLGASNLIDGVRRGARDGWATVELATGDVVRIPATGAAEGSQVKVGVRPEKLAVFANGSDTPAGDNAIRARLVSSVFMGVSYQYFFEAGGGRQLSAFARNAGHGAVAEPGEQVRLAWKPEHTFVIAADGAAQPSAGKASVGSGRSS
jgi:ABC-type Fe3+/spermidine/putrescine transport system ATPase subunit